MRMECASNVRKDHQFWMNLYDLIQQAASTWISQERANAQSLPGQVVQHIATAGKLRQPQREALEVYLGPKFAGKNASLNKPVPPPPGTDKDGRKWAGGNLTAKGLKGSGYEYEYKGAKSLWRCPLETMERSSLILRFLGETKGLKTT